MKKLFVHFEDLSFAVVEIPDSGNQWQNEDKVCRIAEDKFGKRVSYVSHKEFPSDRLRVNLSQGVVCAACGEPFAPRLIETREAGQTFCNESEDCLACVQSSKENFD